MISAPRCLVATLLAFALTPAAAAGDDPRSLMANAWAAQLCSCIFVTGGTVESCKADDFLSYNAMIRPIADITVNDSRRKGVSVSVRETGYVGRATYWRTEQAEYGCVSE